MLPFSLLTELYIYPYIHICTRDLGALVNLMPSLVSADESWPAILKLFGPWNSLHPLQVEDAKELLSCDLYVSTLITVEMNTGDIYL